MKFNIAMAALAVAVVTPASAAITVVNNAAAFGPSRTTLTLDTPSDNSIARLSANHGVTTASTVSGATIFVTGPGNFAGIGVLGSNALGSSFNGLVSDISHAPDYSGSTLRGFDLSFAAAVTHFGVNVFGWGLPWIDHRFTLYDASNAVLGSYTFAASGLSVGDSSPNGFAGFISDGATISRVRVTASSLAQDFVAFDNITFVSAPTLSAVPEPAAWALMLGGFGLVGAAMRRRGFIQATLASI